MSNFGTELRQERERQKISLEEMAQQTKISLRHLRALEDEQFEQLPGGIFNRGIVRAYVSCLGLDEQPWVLRYAETFRTSGLAKDSDLEYIAYAESLTGEKSSEPGREDIRLRWAGITVLLLVLAIVALVLWHFLHRHIATAAPANTSQLLDWAKRNFG
jgi:cytoskeleton protein RodZ